MDTMRHVVSFDLSNVIYEFTCNENTYCISECPDSCPNYGDSDDSQPVCGKLYGHHHHSAQD